MDKGDQHLWTGTCLHSSSFAQALVSCGKLHVDIASNSFWPIEIFIAFFNHSQAHQTCIFPWQVVSWDKQTIEYYDPMGGKNHECLAELRWISFSMETIPLIVQVSVEHFHVFSLVITWKKKAYTRGLNSQNICPRKLQRAFHDKRTPMIVASLFACLLNTSHVELRFCFLRHDVFLFFIKISIYLRRKIVNCYSSFLQEDMPKFRKQVVYEILMKKLLH